MRKLNLFAIKAFTTVPRMQNESLLAFLTPNHFYYIILSLLLTTVLANTKVHWIFRFQSRIICVYWKQYLEKN